MQHLPHSVPRPSKLTSCSARSLVARYSSTFSSLCCVSNNATNSHDTINDNHYQSATGDTVQLEMKCMQKGGHHWGDLERCIGQRRNKKARTKTNYAQRGIHLEIERTAFVPIGYDYDFECSLSCLAWWRILTYLLERHDYRKHTCAAWWILLHLT